MSQRNNFRILVIDDNVAIHADFIKVLTASSSQEYSEETSNYAKIFFGKNPLEKPTLPKFQIDTASQGQEGVEKIAKAIQEGNPYALAFVDIRMPPGWDGVETIKHIWEIDQNIQVVICTAYSDYSWEETVEQLGQSENLLILKKPFDTVAVRQLSCALTKKWQLMQEARDYTKLLEERVEERTSSLQESLSVTRGALESSSDGILVVNKENTIIDYNKNLINMWKITPVMVEEKNANILLEYISTQVENPSEWLERISKLISNHCEAVSLEKLKCKDQRIIEYCLQPYKKNNTISGRIWTFRDITQRAMLESKIEHQATYDELTGLPNRALLIDRILQAIAKSKREKCLFGILFFDLDRFKLINDSFSHKAGDELLRAVANRIQTSVREMDTLARLGGDEFVGVVSSLNDETDAGKIADKILHALSKPFQITDHEVIISTSIGISVYPRDGNNVEEILRSADAAMYRAKELGGKQFQFYTSELNQQSLERLEVESDLNRALANNEFVLCYQPQYNLRTNQIVSVEALIRWQHPKKGLILPIDFIPLAEETGLIVPIGEWVLRTACKQNKHWQKLGLPKVRIAVNVTTHEFKQPDLVMKIQKILNETGLEPKYLELELTENIIISNIDTSHIVSELKNMGISIALDDFGTGYSSINYLRKIPLDRLKIDQSFIQNIDIDNGDEVIMQAIITMAKDLNLEILAEGVETKKQLEFLKLRKCGEGQGYYFSKPLSNEEFEILLAEPAEVEE